MNKLIAIFLFLLIPSLCHALGLSGIKLNSSLNQPLNAEIKLLLLRGMSYSDVRVVLASPKDFERIGIEQSNALGQLKLSVTKNRYGRPVIKITSKEPITEPYLELLLDVRWPVGRFFRSYTILLDPPNYIVKAPPPVARRIKSITRRAISHLYKQTQTTYGPVRLSENLWHIAKKSREGAAVSLNQTMVAIVKANPHAFIRGNMNGLKEGANLVIPSIEKMKNISSAKATQEVIHHNRAWQEGETITYAQSVVQEAEEVIQPVAEVKQVESPVSSQTSQAEPTPTTTSQPIEQASEVTPKQTVQLNMQSDQPKNIEKNPLLQTLTQSTSNLEKTLRAELAVSAQATSTVRETNVVLQTQLQTLQEQNQQLRQQVNQRDVGLSELKTQISQLSALLQKTVHTQVTMQQQVGQVNAVAGQAIENNDNDDGGIGNKLLLTAMLLLMGGGSYAWFTRWGKKYLPWLAARLQRDEQEDETQEEATVETVESEHFQSSPDRKRKFDEAVVSSHETGEGEQRIQAPADTSQAEVFSVEQPAESPEQPASEEIVETAPEEKASEEQQALEFESGLSENLTKQVSSDDKQQSEEPTSASETMSIESSHIEEVAGSDRLATQLDLAMVYINMENFDDARTVLRDVLAEGNESQQKEAQNLLDLINKSS